MRATLVAILILGAFLAHTDILAQQIRPTRIIVKWHGSISAKNQSADALLALQKAEAAVGVTAHASHRLGLGAEVVRLNRALSKSELTQFMAELRSQAQVEYVEEDATLTLDMNPEDPLYEQEQWHLFEAIGSVKTPVAWDRTLGEGVIVAVVDSGLLPHEDLAGQVVAGYDLVTDPFLSLDGDGRDASARDPGDASAGNCEEFSSWHGTKVAGTIAALVNNGVGVVGVAPRARLLAIRVTGRCGDSDRSDISDAIIWASGGTVEDAPVNANRARVVNISIGSKNSCSNTMQQAINFARARGVVIVASAGNENIDVGGIEPAGCAGVIAVAAVNRAGAKTYYSNFGSKADLAAPGGETERDAIWSISNQGTYTPGSDGYAPYVGTSAAAPHVAGVAALIISNEPSLTLADIELRLTMTARPFPGPCQGCGTGIVNARAATAPVLTGITPPVWNSEPAQVRNSPTYTLTFHPVNGATHYNMERSINQQTWTATAYLLDTEKTYETPPQRGSYWHRVRACSDYGCGPWRIGRRVEVCAEECQ
jgi:serine protease